MTDVKIDRLGLDLPGMDAEAARALALGVAEGLAGADLTGEHETVAISVDPATAAAPGRLAAHIIQSLVQRIG
jgi:hypothetical protein